MDLATIKLPFLAASAPVTVAQRLVPFTGRQLGEQELDIWQAYQDFRLADLFAGTAAPGIVRGLEAQAVRLATGAITAVTVRPGFGVTAGGRPVSLPAPLRYPAAELLGSTPADGIYLLLLASQQVIDDRDIVDDGGCLAAADSPVRDVRRDVQASLLLAPIAVPAAAGVALGQRLRIANEVALALLGAPIALADLRALPVGLLAVQAAKILWLDTTAVRRAPADGAGYQALFTQAHGVLAELAAVALPALAAATTSVGRTQALSEFERGVLTSFRGLPAAGRLPTDLVVPQILQAIFGLEDHSGGAVAASVNAALPTPLPPASATPPGWPFFGSPNLAVEVLPIRFSDAEAAVRPHLDRGPLLLDAGPPDRVNLLWAVADADYRPDLLSLPIVDTDLLAEVYRQYAASYRAWSTWRQVYDAIYAAPPADIVGNKVGSVDISAVRVDQTEFAGFGCSLPADVVEQPPARFDSMVTRALAARGLNPNQRPQLPVPYRDGAPAPYRSVAEWRAATGESLPDLPPVWSQPGLLLMRILHAREITELGKEINDLTSQLDRLRDHVLLHRQHLDAQTLNMATLSGGVATDGSGLRLIRWSPYIKFDPAPASTVAPKALVQSAATFTESSALREAVNSVPAAVLSRQVLSLKDPGSVRRIVALDDGDEASPVAEKAADLGSIQVDKTPVSAAKFTSDASSFGAISHVRPDVYSHADAFQGMKAIYESAAADDVLRPLLIDTSRVAPPKSDFDPDAAENKGKNAYTLIIGLAQSLVAQLARLEALRANLEGNLRLRVQALAKMRASLAVEDLALAQKAMALRAAANARVGVDGDYALALGLLEEDWANTAAIDEQRRVILSRPLAVYWTRAMTAPVEAPLAYKLVLVTPRAGDLVPGCHVDHPPLPPWLSPFTAALWQVPYASFRKLAPLDLVMARPDLIEIAEHAQMMASFPRPSPPAFNELDDAGIARMNGIHGANAMAFSDFDVVRASPVPQAVPLSVLVQRVAASVGIASLLAGRASPLRQESQALRGRLEQALACLVASIEDAPPDVRLGWAEDEGLPITEPERWSGLAKIEHESLDRARRLVELVHWWFGQLTSDAAPVARTAMQNALRAILIAAAHGDPARLLQGRVVFLPPRFAVGELLKVTLNREPDPGVELQVYNRDHVLVGVGRVDDVAADAVKVRVTRTFVASTDPVSDSYTVVGRRG